MKSLIEDIFIAFGCGRWYRLHKFQWSMGPDVPTRDLGNGITVQESYFGGPGEWWLWCARCGRKA